MQKVIENLGHKMASQNKKAEELKKGVLVPPDLKVFLSMQVDLNNALYSALTAMANEINKNG